MIMRTNWDGIELAKGVECPGCGADMWIEQGGWQGPPSKEHWKGKITRGPGKIVYTGWARCFICNRWEKIGRGYETSENGRLLRRY